MNFELPSGLRVYIVRIDKFTATHILPLWYKDGSNLLFGRRREPSRKELENAELPTPEWETLLTRAYRIADEVGSYDFSLLREYSGHEYKNTDLRACALRYQMASHPVYGGGVSFGNDNKGPSLYRHVTGEFRMTFGLTHTHHGSDAIHMDTRAVECMLSDEGKGYGLTGTRSGRRVSTPPHNSWSLRAVRASPGHLAASWLLLRPVLQRESPSNCLGTRLLCLRTMQRLFSTMYACLRLSCSGLSTMVLTSRRHPRTKTGSGKQRAHAARRNSVLAA
ncbi:hypothetical protein F5X98DRAFT_349525 [Xylaria grammica]|nr:hypothetical protein F5X98DRAFT_349525 [Xylaria grammica]